MLLGQNLSRQHSISMLYTDLFNFLIVTEYLFFHLENWVCFVVENIFRNNSELKSRVFANGNRVVFKINFKLLLSL